MPTITAENEITVKNLLAAFEGESNAHAKYTAFAVKADEDGLHGAASLFRAAGRAEQIHAANHARVIKQLGGEARCEIHAVDVKSTLENLKAILEAAGTDLAKAVKVNVFLKDLNDFAAMNAIYSQYLGPEGVIPPARTTVEAARLPKDVLVEIELVAEV